MNHMRGLELIKNRIRLLAIAQIAILRGEEDPSFAVLGVGFRYGFDGLADEAGAAGYHDGGFGGAVDVVLGHDSFDTPKNEMSGVRGGGSDRVDGCVGFVFNQNTDHYTTRPISVVLVCRIWNSHWVDRVSKFKSHHLYFIFHLSLIISLINLFKIYHFSSNRQI